MSSSEYPGARVVVGQLHRGYAAADERFEECSRDEDPDPAWRRADELPAPAEPCGTGSSPSFAMEFSRMSAACHQP